MEWRNRITIDSAVCHGRPCVRNTRIMAAVILDNLASGQDAQEILRSYPGLQALDIAAVMAYAADLARDPVLSFPAGAN